MPKFSVDVKEVWCHTVEVELPAGATKEQILNAANDKIAEGDEGETEYSHTLDPDTWTVRDL
jgi:hypothetical protein